MGVEAWWECAACRGEELNSFFPREKDDKAIRAAKRICVGCPVRLECFMDALQHDSQGILGGMTYDERQKAATFLRPKCVSSGPDTNTQIPKEESEPRNDTGT